VRAGVGAGAGGPSAQRAARGGLERCAGVGAGAGAGAGAGPARGGAARSGGAGAAGAWSGCGI